MKVTLNIDDDLYEKIVKQVRAKKGETLKVNNRIREIIEEFADLLADPTDRYIVLHGNMRREVEKIFQTTIESADHLVTKLQGLSRFGIGEVIRPLTEGESIQLMTQANFWGQKPAEFVETTMNRVLDETLGRV